MKKILIVDDEKPIQHILKFNLKKNGFDVYIANNGLEGLEKAIEIIPDLILLDIMMPKLTGYEVCEKLKENDDTKDIPVIFLSAKGRSNDKQKANDYGGCCYLTKPFSPKLVIEKIEELIGG